MRRPVFWIAAALLILGLSSGAFVLAQSAQPEASPDDLFQTVPPDEAIAQGAPQGLPPGEPGIRSRIVRLNTEALSYAAGAQVRLNLFEDLTLTASLRQSEAHPRFADGALWIGEIAEAAGGDAVFVSGGGQTFGAVVLPGVVYEVRYAAADLYRIVEIPADDLFAGDSPLTPPRPDGLPVEPPAEVGALDATPNSIAQIDYMVVYTDDARAAAGGTTQIVNAITASVALTNQSFLNSQVYARLRLVRTEEVSYTESGLGSTDLDRVTNPSDGQLDTVPTLRNTYAADVVTLVTETMNDAAGIGWIMDSFFVSNPLLFESYGYNVVERGALPGGLVMAHELGHNFGLAHDLANGGGSGLYSYANGYQQPDGRFRSIMAYSNGCTSPCPWVNQYSSATNTIGGVLIGGATANNEPVLNFSLPYVARFRAGFIATATPTNTPTPPGMTATSGAATSTATPPPGCTVSIAAGNTAALVTAITNANSNGASNDIICLAANSTYTVTAANNGVNGFPVIITPITLVGSGATITKPFAGTFRFFQVGGGGRLTISRLTLENGHLPNDYGGAISVDFNGGITVSDSKFKGNVALGGGAIYAVIFGTSSTIQRTVFTGNSGYFGGALFVYHFNASYAFSIYDSVFTENATSTGSTASSLYTQGEASVVLSNSCLYSNGNTSVYGEDAAISAANNWWGASTGPSLSSNLTPAPGVDMIAGNVTYAPYHLAAPGICAALVNPAPSTPTATATATRTATA
ncbi:MAG: hypothetical protein JNL42_12885, partial [Anaerolineae bacterium]|nr:hypothetical protein [Anaerolineae bacterium]